MNSSLAELKKIISNFPQELSKLADIPCFQISWYCGCLSGSIVSALLLMRSGKLSALKIGFWTFLGVNVISWEVCRYQYRTVSSVQQAIDQKISKIEERERERQKKNKEMENK